MMDTLVTVRLEGRPGTDEEQLKSAAVAALARMEEIAKATDRYDSPSSPLKELAEKAGSGSWVEVGPEVYFLQEEVRKLGAAAAALEPAAEGMVNTAMAPLIDLWAKARQEVNAAEGGRNCCRLGFDGYVLGGVEKQDRGKRQCRRLFSSAGPGRHGT